MPDYSQTFADWLIEQRNITITDFHKRETLYRLILRRIADSRQYHTHTSNTQKAMLCEKLENMILANKPPQQIYEFGKAHFSTFDHSLTVVLQEFDEWWAAPLVLNLSEQPLCEDAWEYYEKVLRAFPDDVLTTRDEHILRHAEDVLGAMLLFYKPAYPKHYRDVIVFCEGYGKHTCLLDVYDKWEDVLAKKIHRSDLYIGEKEPLEIQIISPTHILSNKSHLSEPKDKSPSQPSAQADQPPKHIPKPEKSVSEFLADLDNEE
jgi:hypothetical protein